MFRCRRQHPYYGGGGGSPFFDGGVEGECPYSDAEGRQGRGVHVSMAGDPSVAYSCRRDSPQGLQLQAVEPTDQLFRPDRYNRPRDPHLAATPPYSCNPYG